jgi:hypothetical protein
MPRYYKIACTLEDAIGPERLRTISLHSFASECMRLYLGMAISPDRKAIIKPILVEVPKIDPSNVDMLLQSKSELEQVISWSKEDADYMATVSYQEKIKEYNLTKELHLACLTNCKKLLSQMISWPLEGNFRPFKAFSLSVLNKLIIKYDNTRFICEPTKLSGIDYQRSRIRDLRHSIRLCEKQINREEVRINELNKWARGCLESIDNYCKNPPNTNTTTEF